MNPGAHSHITAPDRISIKDAFISYRSTLKKIIVIFLPDSFSNRNFSGCSDCDPVTKTFRNADRAAFIPFNQNFNIGIYLSVNLEPATLDPQPYFSGTIGKPDIPYKSVCWKIILGIPSVIFIILSREFDDLVFRQRGIQLTPV
ncbi:MAG: hypothetical protein M3O22_05620 [Pseudomonadota bacterium]|nr:hypothetical protein [Pseudomonadota bacterium]